MKKIDKITEEVMTSLIRRIEIIEKDIGELKDKDWKPKYVMKIENKPRDYSNQTNPGQASKAQIDYLRSLGGKTWPDMTKGEAGNGIDKILESKSHSESLRVTEPKEVDTDNAGLDEGDLL